MVNCTVTGQDVETGRASGRVERFVDADEVVIMIQGRVQCGRDEKPRSVGPGIVAGKGFEGSSSPAGPANSTASG